MYQSELGKGYDVFTLMFVLVCFCVCMCVSVFLSTYLFSYLFRNVCFFCLSVYLSVCFASLILFLSYFSGSLFPSVQVSFCFSLKDSHIVRRMRQAIERVIPEDIDDLFGTAGEELLREMKASNIRRNLK